MLISCKECNHKVSDKAGACPNCGYPLRSIKPIVKSKEGLFLKSMNLGCLLFIIFVVLGSIMVFNAIWGKTPTTIN